MHDQLKVSRQLTEQKAYEPDSEDEENLEAAEDEELPLLKATADNADNPWLLGHESFSKGFCSESVCFPKISFLRNCINSVSMYCKRSFRVTSLKHELLVLLKFMHHIFWHNFASHNFVYFMSRQELLRKLHDARKMSFDFQFF